MDCSPLGSSVHGIFQARVLVWGAIAFFGRNDAKAETPYFGDLIGKDSDAGRDWGQEEKGTTEDEMAGWHH